MIEFRNWGITSLQKIPFFGKEKSPAKMDNGG
jgi:hypothetical protein